MSREITPYSRGKSAILWLLVGLGASYLFGLVLLKTGLPLPVSFYLVQSGSMEPAINTGDIVVVKSQLRYHERETITFYDGDHRVVTHRIVKSQNIDNKKGLSRVFITKGDANQDPDSVAVSEDKVLGKVVMVLPKMGFIVSFAKTRYGALLLIVAPAIIIIYDEWMKMTEK